MVWIKLAGRRGIAGSATALALACGDSDPPSVNAGSIHIAVNPASLSIPQGADGPVSLSLTRGGSFHGAVSLSITGFPAGVIATISPTQLPENTSSAAIDIVVTAPVPVGSYTATIIANGQGVPQAAATIQLTVTPPPNYTLTITPISILVTAGSSGSATVNINRTNFTEGVTLSLQNPPAGITGTFNPSSSTTNASVLVVSVAANVAVADYQLIIQGTATGIPSRTAALQLSVSSPPSGPNNVEYQFCDPTAVPAFFAFQDGTSAWQAVAPVTSGTVTTFGFNIPRKVAVVFLSSRRRRLRQPRTFCASVARARSSPQPGGWASEVSSVAATALKA